MSGDVHVRFRERLEGKFLGATGHDGRKLGKMEAAALILPHSSKSCLIQVQTRNGMGKNHRITPSRRGEISFALFSTR